MFVRVCSLYRSYKKIELRCLAPILDELVNMVPFYGTTYDLISLGRRQGDSLLSAHGKIRGH